MNLSDILTLVSYCEELNEDLKIFIPQTSYKSSKKSVILK